MIRCDKCGTFYEELTQSNCPKCGEKAHLSAGKCLLCGKESERGDVCQKCVAAYQITGGADEQVPVKRKSIVMPLIVSLISLACIIGLTMLILMPFQSNDNEENAVSQIVYDNGEYVIKVLDLYLDGVCSSEETRDKLEYFSYNNKGEDSIDDSLLDAHILNARLFLLRNEISKVKEERNKIADMIGYEEQLK